MNRFAIAVSLVLGCCIVSSALELPDAGLKEAQTIKGKEEMSIQPNGDIIDDLTLTLPINEYNRVQRANVNAYRLVRDLKYQGGVLQKDTKVTHDDGAHSYRVVSTVCGAIKHSTKRCEGKMEKNYEFVSLADHSAAFSFLLDLDNGFRIQGNSYVKLPEGASDAKWDASSRTLSYVLPDTSQGIGSIPLLGLTVFFALCTFTFGLCWLAVTKPEPKAS